MTKSSDRWPSSTPDASETLDNMSWSQWLAAVNESVYTRATAAIVSAIVSGGHDAGNFVLMSST